MTTIDKIYKKVGYIRPIDESDAPSLIKNMLWAYRLGRKEANKKKKNVL